MTDLKVNVLAECEYRQGSAGIIKCKLIGGLEVEQKTCLHCPVQERKLNRAKQSEAKE